MPPKRKSTKRRRKKRRDERAARIRNTLIGGGVVMAIFVVVGMVALHELQVEQDERRQAEQATVSTPAPHRKPTQAPSGDPVGGAGHGTASTRLADLRLKLPALQPGLPEKQVLKLLGAPDMALSDHRFRYSELGLDVEYRPTPTGKRLVAVQMTGEGVSEYGEALGMPAIRVGAPPDALRKAFRGGKLVFHRQTNSYTLYLPGKHLAIDFTAQAITAIRMDERLNQQFEADRTGPRSFEVSFDQAFDAGSMLGQPLTDNLLTTTIHRVPNPRVPVHTVDIHLKTDLYTTDDLKAAIKRRVAMQMAAGDAATAIHVYAKNGSKIVSCDWYSPSYGERSGQEPQRFGDVDSLDNISYRWY